MVGTGYMRVRSKRPGYVPKKAYECSMYRKYGKDRCCSHHIKEEYLLENFKSLLIELRKEYKDILADITLEKVQKSSKSNSKKLDTDLKIAKKEYSELIKEKIKQIAKGRESKQIIIESFEELENEALAKINQIEGTIKRINSQDDKAKVKKIKRAIDYFDEIVKSDKPDKTVLNEVLDKIIIYQDKSVEFRLKMSIDKLI